MNTPSPFIEKFPEVEGEGAQAAQPDHIYLDAMGFGMGMCCLQVELQTKPKTKKRKEVALVCKNTYTVESIHLELVPAFLYSLYLTLFKTDISPRWTLSAGPKGVHLGES